MNILEIYRPIYKILCKQERRWHEQECAVWRAFQAQIERERLANGRRWAIEDLALLARGQNPRGCPRFTPELTLREYRRVIESVSLPVNIRERAIWKINTEAQAAV